jgi:hypothetical protein
MNTEARTSGRPHGQEHTRPEGFHLPRAAWVALGYAAAVAAALGVFMMYLQPHFLRDLADQIWACF